VLARPEWIGIKYEIGILKVIARILQTTVLIGIAASAWGQNISQLDVPIRIRVPVDQEVVLTAHATGSQIYVCQPPFFFYPFNLLWMARLLHFELLRETLRIVSRPTTQ
jgi:hypothetical protein